MSDPSRHRDPDVIMTVIGEGLSLPHYQRLITEPWPRQGGSYLTAARLLVRLRDASTAAGTPSTFTTFMTTTTEANRRRPTCIDAFVRAGLIRADRTIIGT